jgi:hypothetical protein
MVVEFKPPKKVERGKRRHMNMRYQQQQNSKPKERRKGASIRIISNKSG